MTIPSSFPSLERKNEITHPLHNSVLIFGSTKLLHNRSNNSRCGGDKICSWGGWGWTSCIHPWCSHQQLFFDPCWSNRFASHLSVVCQWRVDMDWCNGSLWDYEAWAPNEPSANPVDGDYVEFNNGEWSKREVDTMTRITLMAIFVRGSQQKIMLLCNYSKQCFKLQ